jgi:hypothetical protein
MSYITVAQTAQETASIFEMCLPNHRLATVAARIA